MADSSLLSLIAQGPGRFDFSALGDIPKAYWEGQDQAQKQKLRDAFEGGLPMTDGSPDYGAMLKTLGQLGAVDQIVPLAGLSLQQQKLKYGTTAAREDFPEGAPGTSTIGPPSSSRGAQITERSRDGSVNPRSAPPSGYTGGDNGNSVMAVVTARRGPEDAGPLALQIAQQAGVDPNEPLTDPAKRARVVQAMQMVMGQGQQPEVQPQQGSVPLPPPSQQQPMPPKAALQAQPGLTGAAPSASIAPIDDPTLGGLVPTGRTGGQQIRLLSQRIATGNLLPEQVKNYQANIEAIQQALIKRGELSPEQKAYYADRQPNESMADYQARVAGGKAYSEDEAKRFGKKYDALNELGTRAATELPQLELIQKQMNDPNFYSGFGSKYNLLWKQMAAGAAHAFPSLGLDPNAAFSQEAFGKVVSGNILNSLGQLKGLGQIRVAEINLAKEASAAGNYSIPANKVLVEISKRLHERSLAIADMASSYNNGRLDAGFDRLVSSYNKTNPLFRDDEIKSWKRIIGGDGQNQAASSSSPLVPAAKQAPDGNWYVADPKRPGKYLEVR